MWLTIRQVVLYIIWFELARVAKMCFNIGLGLASKLSANYFDCLKDCSIILLIDIFGNIAD